jgi:hypothetical protein
LTNVSVVKQVIYFGTEGVINYVGPIYTTHMSGMDVDALSPLGKNNIFCKQ